MKKLLVTGGVLFSILPAMATDLSLSDWHLIDSNTANPTCSGPEGYTGFVNGDVTMAPLYIQQCDPGYYLNATSETQIQEHQDSNEDLDYYYIQACTQCPAGHSCAGVSNPTVVNDSLGVMGLGAECSAGTYATAGQSSCTACAPGTYTAQTGQSSCINAQAGYYTPNTTSEELCPTGYQDGAAGSGTTIDACSKTVNSTYCNNLNPCSNFNNIVTSGNNACATSVNSNNANIVNGSVAFGAKNAEPLCLATFECIPGHTKQNIYAWVGSHLDHISSNYSYCAPSGITNTFELGKDNPGLTKSDCSNNEAGTSTMRFTDAPMDEAHFVVKCSSTPADPNAIIQTSISDTPGIYCWMRNTDFTNQPWFFNDVYESVEKCAERCGAIYMSEANQAYLLDSEDWDTYRFVFQGLAQATDGQSGRPTADVCLAGTVHINWAGVAEPGAAATCTYGEGLTVPTPDTNPEGYNFVGWTVGEVINDNNQNNNEPSNEEPSNEEPE